MAVVSWWSMVDFDFEKIINVEGVGTSGLNGDVTTISSVRKQKLINWAYLSMFVKEHQFTCMVLIDTWNYTAWTKETSSFCNFLLKPQLRALVSFLRWQAMIPNTWKDNEGVSRLRMDLFQVPSPKLEYVLVSAWDVDLCGLFVVVNLLFGLFVL